MYYNIGIALRDGEFLTNGLRDIRSRRLTTYVAGVEGQIGGHLLDDLHHALSGAELAKMLEQHDDRPERANRVGKALPMMSPQSFTPGCPRESPEKSSR